MREYLLLAQIMRCYYQRQMNPHPLPQQHSRSVPSICHIQMHTLHNHYKSSYTCHPPLSTYNIDRTHHMACMYIPSTHLPRSLRTSLSTYASHKTDAYTCTCVCIYRYTYPHTQYTKKKGINHVDLHFQFIFYFDELLTTRSRVSHIELAAENKNMIQR